MLTDSTSLKEVIATLNKLDNLNSIDLKDIRRDYGDCWASIFDELRNHHVVSSPDDKGKVCVYKSYIPPARRYYRSRLRDNQRILAAFILSIVSITIVLVDLLVKLL